MNDLSDLSIIKRLDSRNVLGSIKSIPSQCKQAWEETSQISFPDSYENIDNIVIAGMGGSSYGVRIIKALYDGAEMVKTPIELSNGYWLPGFVNEKSLVILSSYSGTTEETLACLADALKKKAKITGITSGGNLAHFLEENKYPSYVFKPTYNTCGQPRNGFGYMTIGLIGMLAGLKKIPVEKEEIEQMIDFLEEKNHDYDEKTPDYSNLSKRLAFKLKERIPIFIVSDFLEGAVYGLRNQFHETAKQFAVYFSIPELNHHLLEGFSFPGNLKNIITCVFVESKIYDKKNIKRLKLTKEIVKRNKIDGVTINLSGYSALTQVMELMQISSWTCFYLAMLNNIDPSKIPYVDFFKKRLEEENYEK